MSGRGGQTTRQVLDFRPGEKNDWLPARKRQLVLLLTVILGASVISGPGCRLAGPEHKMEAQIHTQKDIAANQNQVRLRMRALVDPMCDELEQAADAISAGTTNLPVRKAALRWKIEGVPALRKALFQPDGFTALMDTWVLCNQMADYFEKGAGKEALGPASAQALAACRCMEEEMTRVAASITVSGEVSTARAFARKWAAEHPIRYSIAGRESTLSQILQQDTAGSFSTGEAAAEITTAVDDLSRKLDIYSDQLFRQARWEGEQFKLALLEGLSVDQAIPLAERAVRSSEQAVATLQHLAPAVERAVGVTEGAPKVLASEREAVINALAGELKTTLEFAREERIAALETLSRERVAALNELGEKMAVQRLAMSRDMEQISFKVVDHAVWRVAQLVGVTVMVLLLAATAGLHLLRRMFFETPLKIQSRPSRLSG